MSRPEREEVAPHFHKYIDLLPEGNIVDLLQAQFDDTLTLLSGVSEEKSLYRYAPDKWSIRQAQNHVNDTERAFAFRALWFGRSFQDPLLSFDQNVSVPASGADATPWANHVEEFRTIRAATLSLFRNLPPEAWMRSGVVSGNAITVRALACVTAGHVEHHNAILRERYL